MTSCTRATQSLLSPFRFSSYSAFRCRAGIQCRHDSSSRTPFTVEALPPTSKQSSDMKFYRDGKIVADKCGVDSKVEEEEEMEEMFVKGPMGIEWNGPTRGKTTS